MATCPGADEEGVEEGDMREGTARESEGEKK